MSGRVRNSIPAIWSIAVALLLSIPGGHVHAQQVNGLNVRTVGFAGGTFVQTDGQNWIEYSAATGQPAFYFIETFRNENEVKLFDTARKVHIAFSFLTNQVWYAPDGSPMQPLYGITGTFSQSVVPDGPVEEGFTLTCNGDPMSSSYCTCIGACQQVNPDVMAPGNGSNVPPREEGFTISCDGSTTPPSNCTCTGGGCMPVNGNDWNFMIGGGLPVPQGNEGPTNWTVVPEGAGLPTMQPQ